MHLVYVYIYTHTYTHTHIYIYLVDDNLFTMHYRNYYLSATFSNDIFLQGLIFD